MTETSATRGPSWHVRRTGGVLVPGFTKRFGAGIGTTYWCGVPIGRFDVHVLTDDMTELRYRRWPVVDVIDGVPIDAGRHAAAGYVRLPGGRRFRFCRFTIER